MLEIELKLDSKVRNLTRTRYSFWTALGDIGGFYDGIIILARILMSPLSAAIFMSDLTGGGHVLPQVT